MSVSVKTRLGFFSTHLRRTDSTKISGGRTYKQMSNDKCSNKNVDRIFYFYSKNGENDFREV